MSDFRIFETDEYKTSLGRLSAPAAEFVRRKLDEYVYRQLKENPFFAPNIRKLQGYEPETWRYRMGRFRGFYTVDQQKRIVFILTTDDRKDAYR